MKAKTIVKNTANTALMVGILATSLVACKGGEQEDAESTITAATVEVEEFKLDDLMERTDGLYTEEFNDLKARFSEQKSIYEKNESDFQSLLKLAEIYIYEARVSGEHPYYYSAANNVLDKLIMNQYSLTEDEYFTALFYKSTVQLSQHHFEDALTTAQKATDINNMNAGIYGVLVDANVELGNYDEAVKMCDTMMLIRPDLRSYSRTSYLREIYGDMDGSKRAMEMAINAGAPYSEYKCWSIVTLGKIHESQGELDSAMAYYEFAITERKDYPFGLAGMAGVHAKRGELEKAKELLEQAINAVPEIGFHIDLARIMKEEGDTEALNAKIAEVEEMFKEDIESGHNMNLEYASFLLEFKNDAKGALEKAELELAERKQNIDVNKNLAIINYQLGKKEVAKNHLEIAMKTNKQDAELICIKGLLENNPALVEESFAMNPYQSHVLVDEAKKMIN